ncbi:SCAN domain-containing protein 3-like isoform X1 [Pseudorca crassidens]|uniref:SCAN domain-containing protein 3-like isoform X1 n=2 Tax=Pseudorca crassidens TaxID=82174 RepID=UPI00352F06CF
MDHLSPAAGQNLLRTTGGYSVKGCLHVVSVAPGNCRISWSSNNTISQKERKPSLLQQPYPSLRRIRIGLVEEDVHEDMLCALLLPTNTTAAELFKSLNDYISGKLNWSFSVGICTDRVAAMTGRLSGFTTRVKEVASERESTHCVIHREMLASRKMSPELNNVLQVVIKIVNHIKVHALNSRLFAQLCEEMDTKHTRLLLYIEVRWLSKGRSLAKVFELRELLQRFLLEKQSPLAAHSSDTECVTKLAYLCDIFNLLSKLSLSSLRGRMVAVFKLARKVASFKAKLELWGQQVNIGTFVMFQALAEILKETEPGPTFSLLVHVHQSQLSKEFEHYFPTTKDPRTGKEWIHNPFVNKPVESTLSVLEEDQLLEIANDGGLKSLFEGFPGGAVVESPLADARGRGFVPQSGKIPHAVGRLGP